jgi:hypothetical protein
MAITPVCNYTSPNFGSRLESCEKSEQIAAATMEKDPLCPSPLSFDHFNEKYVEKKFYNAAQLDQVDKFLLAETHGSKKSNPTNGEFVSFLASQFPVILFVEGVECMEEILDESVIQHLMDKFCIAPEARDKMRFIGWDARKESENAFQLHSELLQCGYVMQMDDQTIKSVKDRMPVLMDGSVDLTIIQDTLKSTLSILERNFPKAKKNCEKIQTLRPQLAAEIIRTFPIRTETMISSLRQSGELILSFASKVKMVWTCGTAHLLEKSHDERLNLDPLREELHNHRAVTMIPLQVDKIEEYSSEEQRRFGSEGKMAANYPTLKHDVEDHLANWTQTIALLKKLFV